MPRIVIECPDRDTLDELYALCVSNRSLSQEQEAALTDAIMAHMRGLVGGGWSRERYDARWAADCDEVDDLADEFLQYRYEVLGYDDDEYRATEGRHERRLLRQHIWAAASVRFWDPPLPDDLQEILDQIEDLGTE